MRPPAVPPARHSGRPATAEAQDRLPWYPITQHLKQGGLALLEATGARPPSRRMLARASVGSEFLHQELRLFSGRVSQKTGPVQGQA